MIHSAEQCKLNALGQSEEPKGNRLRKSICFEYLVLDVSSTKKVVILSIVRPLERICLMAKSYSREGDVIIRFAMWRTLKFVNRAGI
jgi:hypothetical protein